MNDQFILTPFFLDEPVPELLELCRADWEINQPGFAGDNKQLRMIALHRPLATAVATAVAEGRRPISIAGDCCTTIGVLAGLQQGGLAPTLLWLDAHGDFNTWETTPSGFLGGMPLAMLVGLGEQTMVRGSGLRTLPTDRVILSDARDLDPGERELVAQSGIAHVTAVAELLDYPLPDGPLYVHFDVDVINPEFAPAMSYPAPGGPTPETLRAVFRRLRESGQVAAVSLSAWNPALDEDGRSRKVAMELLGELLG